MSTVIVTYLYPLALKYVSQFISTLNEQITKSFNLIVFNDSVEKPERYFTSYEGKIQFVSVTGAPAQVRFQSLQYLAKVNVDYIIFQDIDDLMSNNRIEVVSSLLDKYGIVCNDLSLINETGKLYRQSVWSTRMPDGFTFYYDYIIEKNVVGLGNSGIKRTILQNPLLESAMPLVADWFIFYQLMKKGNIEAVFTSKCQTLYRQHVNNMAGIKPIDAERIKYIINVKKAHYTALIEIGFNMTTELNKIIQAENRLAYMEFKPMNNNIFFWWEETSVLI